MDADLASIQNARSLLERAHVAQKSFAHATQAEVDRIVDAMARAATDRAEELARLAVEESGLGRVESKIQKNLFVSQYLHNAYKNQRTCGVIREDSGRGVTEIASPVGIVAGIIPITNPTSTAIFKILIAVKGRNSIVLSPHPYGTRCIGRSTEICRRAAIAAGAPEDLILCMDKPTLEGTGELMRHELTSVVVATGGPGVVKAAYSSGKPAFGVGPGNPPVFIHPSADLQHAARCLVASQTFDYGTICSSEQSLVVEHSVSLEFREALKQQGVHFCNDNERTLLQRCVQTHDGRLNTKIVGQSASRIAELAGFKVPATTPILVAAEEGVGREFPLSREKLAPILAWYEVDSWEKGCELCIELIRYDGDGHTMGIHCRDADIVRAFGLEKPVARIIVNGPTTQGSIGFSTSLPPSMTLGCGSMGGNITSDNLGPQHLVNLKRIAYPRVAFFQEQQMPLSIEDCAAAPGDKPVASSSEGNLLQNFSKNSTPEATYGDGTVSPAVAAMVARALKPARTPPERRFYDDLS